ncbi:MAG: hypothetical protein AAB967_04425, partial [Patescibacteria group bacterium]
MDRLDDTTQSPKLGYKPKFSSIGMSSLGFPWPTRLERKSDQNQLDRFSSLHCTFDLRAVDLPNVGKILSSRSPEATPLKNGVDVTSAVLREKT